MNQLTQPLNQTNQVVRAVNDDCGNNVTGSLLNIFPQFSREIREPCHYCFQSVGCLCYLFFIVETARVVPNSLCQFLEAVKFFVFIAADALSSFVGFQKLRAQF